MHRLTETVDVLSTLPVPAIHCERMVQRRSSSRCKTSIAATLPVSANIFTFAPFVTTHNEETFWLSHIQGCTFKGEGHVARQHIKKRWISAEEVFFLFFEYVYGPYVTSAKLVLVFGHIPFDKVRYRQQLLRPRLIATSSGCYTAGGRFNIVIQRRAPMRKPKANASLIQYTNLVR